MKIKKKNKKLLEKLNQDFDFRECIPLEDDFKKIANKYIDYLKNGEDANWISTPWGVSKTVTNTYKKIRYMAASMFLGYKDLKDILIKDLVRYEFEKEDLKEILQFFQSHTAAYANNVHKYSEFIKQEIANSNSNLKIDKDKLTEASSSLTPEQKMDMWHNGTRNQNITACGDDKLKKYFDICKQKRYIEEGLRLIEEAKARGISIAFVDIYIDVMDIHPVDGSFLLSQKNNPQIILDNIGLDFHQGLIYLLWAMCLKELKEKNITKIITQYLLKFVEKNSLKTILTRISKKQELIQRLADCLDPAVLTEDLEEDIEKHENLNPKLWDENNELKPEVTEKINEIVEEFLKFLKEDNIKIKVKDVVLIGSNCSYNYTKDSDLDIHIIADTKSLKCPDDLYPVLYSAYRSLFNKKFDIEFYNIPVEVYVETEGMPRVTNGCYSVKNQKWVKEPDINTIPDFNKESFDKEFQVWENKYNDFLGELATSNNSKEEIKKIEDFINDIYEVRKQGLSKDGEYDTGNLIFKEFRNKGYLDNLKELKDELIGANLSLDEPLQEQDTQINSKHSGYLTKKEIDTYRNMIFKVSYIQPIIQENGIFYIYGVRESEVNQLMSKLKNIPNLKNIAKSRGKLEYSRHTPMGIEPTYKYNIHGNISIN